MAFQSHGSRIKALEFALSPQGCLVVVQLPTTPADEIAKGEQLLADAKAAGLPSVAVRVIFSECSSTAARWPGE
ncbi:MAG: hypothetical protein QM704_14840 [Anaeromyxobacteraceae bacterium]